MRVFSSRTIISFSITVLSILGYGLFAFAITQPYTPGETNDPTCAPNSTNCYVEQLFATTNSTYTWIGNGSGQNGGSTDNTFFAGIGAGDGASNADYSNFIGTGAGTNAVNANNSNFFGQSAGCNATNADNSNFFGQEAGCYATEANNSNFFGNSAGWTAVNAAYSTFFGDKAGYLAADATKSNFVGFEAGYKASEAYHSNFMGFRSGQGATYANDSNFFGYEAGTGPCIGDPIECELTVGAVGASNSLLIGKQAGYNELSEPEFLTAGSNIPGLVGNSNFIGYQAGYGAAGAANSSFVGFQAGFQARNALASNFFGNAAGYQATEAKSSNFIGNVAGYQATNASNSTFLGNFSGFMATYADTSVFMGARSGRQATRASNSVFAGYQSGYQATDASNSIFMGTDSGYQATGAYQAVFLGDSSGQGANDAPFSTFMGFDSGTGAAFASNSIFIGHNAGWSAVNAPNSIFIGSSAGISDNVSNSSATVTYSGASGSFDVGELVTDMNTSRSFYIFSDSGSVLEIDGPSDGNMNPGDTIQGSSSGVTATIVSTTPGTYSILIGDHSSTSGYENSIALGTQASNSKSNQFMLGSDPFPIDQFVMFGSGGTTCAMDANGTACSSDERLKTNIIDLDTSILDKLTQVKTVHFNWKEGADTKDHIGFIAQDMQEYFPELVSTGAAGYLSVNYAGITPILVEGIRELNLKIGTIENFASEQNQGFIQSLINWLGDELNGLTLIISDTLKARSEICIDDVCMTKDQLRTIINKNVSGGFGYGYGGNG